MPLDISDMRSIFQNAFTMKKSILSLGRAICLDKALFTILFRYIKVFCLYDLHCLMFIILSYYLYSQAVKKHFCTRCLKHFTEQRTLIQHKWYCKTEVEPGNLIDALRDTGGYSKEVREARWDKIRRYLDKLDAEKQGATI